MPEKFNLTGISDIRIAPAAAKISKRLGGRGLVITTDTARARRIAGDLSFFAGAPVLVMPDDDTLFNRYDARSSELSAARLASCRLLAREGRGIVVAPVKGALKLLPPKSVFLKNVISLKVGEETDRDGLLSRLVDMGYERSGAVSVPGFFAVRGDIIDVFCPGALGPFRIELFDTEIDGIRIFDPLSQRSLKNLEEADIYPARLLQDDAVAFLRAEKALSEDKNIDAEDRAFAVGCIKTRMNFQYLERYMKAFYPDAEHIWDYLDGPSFVMLDAPGRLRETLKEAAAKEEEEGGPGVWGREKSSDGGFAELVKGIELGKAAEIFSCSAFSESESVFEGAAEREIKFRGAPVFNGRLDMFVNSVRGFLEEGYKVNITGSEARLANLRDLLERSGIEKVTYIPGSLSTGFVSEEAKTVYISEGDIFPFARKSKRRERKDASPIKAFTDLQKGDLVVHEIHGIGRFTGVKKMEVHGNVRDYLKIEYAGSDVLYVPVEQMDSVQKYIGGDTAPKISSLSSGEWQKTKAKAKAAVKDMAKDFLKLSAERAAAPGYSFGPDSVWQKEFEDAFPYVETDDQLRCTEEIKRDMESSKPMDRLLCGDVGYGKTEVAMRAVFKCVEGGKQAAVLVPTTVLASQHLKTFTERFKDYPFKIEMLSRFKTPNEQKKIVSGLAAGTVDLVIGTHRLLSGDIKFKDLGLLVVDEEQRFGVTHKNAIKKLKANVDVLTLTATPIPRTLHMSLSGIRDMSIIEEPPEDRYPVQTYVMEEDDGLLRRALKRELARGGQAFVVFNRIDGINAMARRLQYLVPEARISVGHGKMSEQGLEDVMIDFAEGRSDILVATSIIESGLDMPNVNTLAVIDADRFGLSQLYQIRGRVGRSNRMAYAYLMYKKDKNLSEIAEKRLRAVKEFTEFGSGFRIAMRDLELRGAGNILGTEQSGHMLSVGYELYCRMVEDAVRELKGEARPVRERESSVDLGIPAYIPHEYISDEMTRLDMYKAVSACKNAEDRSDLLDELTDRFGEPPKETRNLIEIAMTRNLARRAGISKVASQRGRLVFLFSEDCELRPEVFLKLTDEYGKLITVYGGTDPRLSLETDAKGLALAEKAEQLLNIMLK